MVGVFVTPTFESPSLSRRPPQHAWLLVLLTLPWVQPYAPSPLSNVMPWLISWVCLALAALRWRHITPAVVFQSWAMAALISSGMALLQYFGQADVLWLWVNVPSELGNAMGNLRQRNQLATLLSMGLLAVVWWRLKGLSLAHALLMSTIISVALAATSSRTGLLQIVAVTVWLALPWRQPLVRQAFWLCVYSLGVYAVAAWVLPWCLQAVTGYVSANAMVRLGGDDGCASRKVLWSNVLHLIAQKPWTGWGWDALRQAHYMTDYSGPRFCAVMGNAHNLPLHLAFVWGVPATVGLLLALCVGVGSAKPWRWAGPDRLIAWGVLGVIALHSLLEFPLWYGPFQIAVLLCWWVMRGHLVAWGAGFALAIKGVAWALLCGLAWVAYDYQQVRQVYLPPANRWAVWRDKPLDVAKKSWFFEHAALFAELTTTRVKPANAAWVLETSQQLLHSAPDPRVIQQLLLAAEILGKDDLHAFHQARFAAAYPADHARWLARQSSLKNRPIDSAR